MHAKSPDLLDRISLRAWGWIGPIATALLAFFLRVVHLGQPNQVVFDETYYAKDAYSLLKYGYARQYKDKVDDQVIAGQLQGIMEKKPSWIVHPDGGKWVIAIGEQFFGFNPFGWRIAAAVVGSLIALVLGRLVLRLTRSPVIATFAGFLWALDGVAFTMSRIALLDIFLAFWLVCAVACLAADRDWLDAKLAEDPRRWRVWRPWQLAGGICFGLATATKWTGITVIAAFGVAVVAWEVFARLRAVRNAPDEGSLPLRTRLLMPLMVGAPAFGYLVVVATAVYLATWTGFFVHHDLYEATFGHGYGDIKPWPSVTHPVGGPFAGIINPLRSWWSFEVMTYDFHTGSYLAKQTHPYQSHPAGWLIQWRPVSVYSNFELPAGQCGAATGQKCVAEIVILGNPAVWWAGVVAYITVGIAWIVALFKRRIAWRFSIPLLGLAGTWLPWFTSGTRPIFSFYAVAILPFTVVALSLCLNGLMRRATTPRTSLVAWLLAGAYIGLVTALFLYFLPVWNGHPITYDQWHSRMWSKHWI